VSVECVLLQCDKELSCVLGVMLQALCSECRSKCVMFRALCSMCYVQSVDESVMSQVLKNVGSARHGTHDTRKRGSRWSRKSPRPVADDDDDNRLGPSFSPQQSKQSSDFERVSEEKSVENWRRVLSVAE